MANTWGLTGKPEPDEPPAGEQPPAKRRPLPPESSRAAHRGIVWIHASAIVVWLIVTLTLGALFAAGKHVPVVVILIGVGALVGHGLFVATHLVLARIAGARARQQS
jgi:hypothetical protein